MLDLWFKHTSIYEKWYDIHTVMFRICVECNVSTLNTDLSKDELTKLGKQVKNTIFHKCNDIFINEIKRQEGKVRFYKSTAFV